MNTTSIFDSKSFGFDIQTSSGDKISFDYLNEKALDSKSSQNGSSISFYELNAYKFSYEGNGIDAQDQIEIEKALEKISPEIKDFFTEEQSDSLTKFADRLDNLLPFTKDENTLGFLKSSLVDTFDKLVSPIQYNRVEDSVLNGTNGPKIEDTFKELRELLDEMLYLLDHGKPMYA